MLITKYKFQIILFSFYTFQTFQVHPHRVVISHFPSHDSGVIVSYPVTRKTVGIIRIILLYSSEPLP